MKSSRVSVETAGRGRAREGFVSVAERERRSSSRVPCVVPRVGLSVVATDEGEG